MPYAPVDGAQLYYEEHGSGTPLLLIHGFSGSGQVWESRVPSFTDRFRVIVPDLRGHGRSSGAPETIHHRTFAADLVALLDHLDIDRAHFLGHSSGGMCLLFVGLHHPERIRSLILSCATYTFDETARRHMRFTADEMDRQPAAIANGERRHGAAHGADYWKVLRGVFRSFTENPQELPFQPADLAAITSPVLVLHGDRDPYFPVNIPTTLYRSLPNAELCILPNTGHGLPQEAPELFLEIVSQFLARHAAA